MFGKILRIKKLILLFSIIVSCAYAQTDTVKVDTSKITKVKIKPIIFFGVEVSRIPVYKVLDLKPYYDLSPFISIQKQNTIYYYRYGIGTNAHSLGIGIRISNR